MCIRRSGRLTTIVSPTAGRVVDRDLAAHRLDEPAGDRQPEADPAAVRTGRRAAGTAGTPRRADRRGMPGPRSTTRRSTRRPTAPASTRTGSSGGDHASALSTTLATPARAAPGRLDTRERLGDVDVDASPRSAEARERGGHDLLEADVAHARAGARRLWSRLMSSRLPTSVFSRSVSSSIVCEQLARRLGRPVDVALQQARDRRLDRRQRRAQVVRHRCEQRRAQLVGLRRAPRRRRPRRAADGARARDASCSAKACEQRWSSAEARGPRTTSCIVGVDAGC